MEASLKKLEALGYLIGYHGTGGYVTVHLANGAHVIVSARELARAVGLATMPLGRVPLILATMGNEEGPKDRLSLYNYILKRRLEKGT